MALAKLGFHARFDAGTAQSISGFTLGYRVRRTSEGRLQSKRGVAPGSRTPSARSCPRRQLSCLRTALQPSGTQRFSSLRGQFTPSSNCSRPKAITGLVLLFSDGGLDGSRSRNHQHYFSKANVGTGQESWNSRSGS